MATTLPLPRLFEPRPEGPCPPSRDCGQACGAACQGCDSCIERCEMKNDDAEECQMFGPSRGAIRRAAAPFPSADANEPSSIGFIMPERATARRTNGFTILNADKPKSATEQLLSALETLGVQHA